MAETSISTLAFHSSFITLVYLVSIYLSISPSIDLSIYLSIYPSIYLSTYLCTYLSYAYICVFWHIYTVVLIKLGWSQALKPTKALNPKHQGQEQLALTYHKVKAHALQRWARSTRYVDLTPGLWNHHTYCSFPHKEEALTRSSKFRYGKRNGLGEWRNIILKRIGRRIQKGREVLRVILETIWVLKNNLNWINTVVIWHKCLHYSLGLTFVTHCVD